jgi:hypothetical protein
MTDFYPLPTQIEVGFGVTSSHSRRFRDDQAKAGPVRIALLSRSERASPTFTKLHSPSPVVAMTSKKAQYNGAFLHCRRSHAVAGHPPPDCPFNCPSI